MTQRQDDAKEMREYIDEQLALMKASMNTAVNANMQLIVETKMAVDTLRKETKPVIDAMKTMENGIRTIGRIGSVGAKIARTVLIAAALWGAFKLLFSGATWSEVYDAFIRAIGK